MLHNSISKLDKFIIEGQLIEEYVLDHVKELMNCLRESNVTLRWLMLHKNCKNKKFKEIIEDGPNK
jgi:WASH complex subunit strumpellin